MAALAHLVDFCRALPPAVRFDGIPLSPSPSQLHQLAETLLPRTSALANVLMSVLAGPRPERSLARLAPLQGSVMALRVELIGALGSESVTTGPRLQAAIQTASSRALKAGLPQCSPIAA